MCERERDFSTLFSKVRSIIKAEIKPLPNTNLFFFVFLSEERTENNNTNHAILKLFKHTLILVSWIACCSWCQKTEFSFSAMTSFTCGSPRRCYEVNTSGLVVSPMSSHLCALRYTLWKMLLWFLHNNEVVLVQKSALRPCLYSVLVMRISTLTSK